MFDYLDSTLDPEWLRLLYRRQQPTEAAPSVLPRAGAPQPAYAGHLSYFGSPEAYAAEIQRKLAMGIPFSDPTAAAQFQGAYPGLFAAPGQLPAGGQPTAGGPPAGGASVAGAMGGGPQATPITPELQQAIAALGQAGGQLPAVPQPQYQTPQQLAALIQSWLGAMDPYVASQTRQTQEAWGQTLQRLVGQWGGRGLAGTPALAMLEQQGVQQMQQGVADIRAQALQQALGQALSFAQLGLSEQGQLWQQGLAGSQFGLQQQQAAVQAALQAAGLTEEARQFGMMYPIHEAGVTGLIGGVPTLQAQQFAHQRATDISHLTGRVDGEPTLQARQLASQQAQEAWARGFQEQELTATKEWRTQQLGLEQQRIDLERTRTQDPTKQQEYDLLKSVYGNLSAKMADYAKESVSTRRKMREEAIRDAQVLAALGPGVLSQEGYKALLKAIDLAFPEPTAGTRPAWAGPAGEALAPEHLMPGSAATSAATGGIPWWMSMFLPQYLTPWAITR